MKSRFRARAGMTLIELVVALTITGLVMTSGYAALSTMADRRMAASQVMDEITRAAAVRSTLAGWLAGAELTIEDDAVVFRGLDGVRDGAPDDELTFRSNVAAGAGNRVNTIRLYVDRNDSTPERGLVAVVSAEPTRTRQLLELEPSITSLDIRYLSGLYGTRDWSASWVSTTVLPLGLEVRLGATPNDSLPPLLQLPLLVALEAAR